MVSKDSNPDLNGTFKLVRNENFDEYLTANGTPWLVRKIACVSSPTLIINQDNNEIEIKLHSRMFKKENKMKVGQDFEEIQMNGYNFKISPYWENNKLVMDYHPLKSAQGYPQKITRELNGDELIVTMELGDIKAKRIFQRDNNNL